MWATGGETNCPAWKLKEVKKWRDIPCAWIWRLKTAKISGFPNLIYWYNIIKTRIILCMISISVNLLTYFYDSENSVSWWIFHVHLKWMCILLMLFEVLLKCQVRLVDCLGWKLRQCLPHSHYFFFLLILYWLLREGSWSLLVLVPLRLLLLSCLSASENLRVTISFIVSVLWWI